MFGHASVEWFTPRSIFDRYNQQFHFRLDPCTSPSNPLGCEIFFTKNQDGLQQEWPEGCNVWINPPYGRGVYRWIAKARDHAQAGKGHVTMLLPNKTENDWFHSYIWDNNACRWRDGVKVEFPKSRVTFIDFRGNKRRGNTFGSIIVIFLSTVACRTTLPRSGAGMIIQTKIVQWQNGGV